MPTYAKSEDWLLQSSLLLEARPETTRITTRYTIRPNIRRTKKSAADNTTTTPAPASKTPLPPRGDLELKTYDPVSGVVLKYRTVKLAEVGRLMQLLGSHLARTQAGVPVREVGGDDELLPDATPAEGSGVATPVVGAVGDKPAAGAAGGGGKGKKKKGKR
ncbi:hypothetical protein CONLIGDRAFT_188411 [Coniochaeta ligniaria NRRL 30616]|uniref:SRP9 domain-containing protein n=1 Tax=Coniochaeta ligniaria NRRL 30616 TaxID=1408157 RepID=A0A1J7J1Q7_9PEZI|nr:hypothetical protein CONLIGDRAFT_188411 [Coniochaeta ligniaria NRRL 30616]